MYALNLATAPSNSGHSALRPTFTALSPYFQFYRYGRPLIPTALRRPIIDLLPSRRVKALLRIIDTMHGNAVRIFEEKKMMAKSGEKVDDEGEIGKDLTTLFRT